MNFFIKQVVLLSLLVFNVVAFAANAPKGVIEEAIEGTPSLVYISKSLNGKVHVKACDDDDCPLLKLKVTPDTKAIFNNKPVSLSSRIDSKVKPELTIYDVRTNKIIELHWYSR